MARNTKIPCPHCGAVGIALCVRGKKGSRVWLRQIPYSPGHSVRWEVNGRARLEEGDAKVHNL